MWKGRVLDFQVSQLLHTRCVVARASWSVLRRIALSATKRSSNEAEALFRGSRHGRDAQRAGGSQRMAA